MKMRDGDDPDYDIDDSEKLYCTCRKIDDGSPMVSCCECNFWFHFACVNYTEEMRDTDDDFLCLYCS